jgi:hypothetical protein
VRRIIYFDSDLIVVDDVAKLWNINLGAHVLGAPNIAMLIFLIILTLGFGRVQCMRHRLRGGERAILTRG